MKQLIVTAALLPLVLILMMQIGLTVKNNNSAYFVQDVVEQAAEEARYKGQFTAQAVKDMKETIADKLELEEDEISVTVTSGVKYKMTHYATDSKIEYKVVVPIKKVVVGGTLFGINADNNKGSIIKEGYVLSERLPE